MSASYSLNFLLLQLSCVSREYYTSVKDACQTFDRITMRGQSNWERALPDVRYDDDMGLW